MIRIASAAVAIAVSTAAIPASAQGRTWVCEDQMDMDKDEAWSIAANIGMFRILTEYRERWDAGYVRQQCEAYAAGEPFEISCLDDRRDWEAIKAAVPAGLFGMSNRELTPFYHDLQMADDGYKAAIEYCRSVGAIE